MNINNRIISLIYRILALGLSSFSLMYDFGIMQGEFKISNLFYFTVISNLFCMGLFLALFIKTIVDIKKDGIYGYTSISAHIKGEIMISIILTMTVYHFILIPYALKINPYETLKPIDIILHYCMPVITIFDWILFDEKKRFKWYDPIIWTIGPYIYIIFVYIQANLGILEKINSSMSKYVYIFLDINKLGVEQVSSNILLLTITFIIIGYLIYGIDRIKISISRKYI